MKIPKTFMPERDLNEKIALLEREKEAKIGNLKELILGEDSGFSNVTASMIQYPERNYSFYPSVTDSVYVNYESSVVCIFEFENKDKLEDNIPSMIEDATKFNARSGSSKNYVITKDEYALFIYGDYPARTKLTKAYKERFEFEDVLIDNSPEICPDKL